MPASAPNLQQLLVALQALVGGAPHYGRNGAPLAGHDLGQVEELFVLLPSPLRLLDAGVQPLVPKGDGGRLLPL